MHEARPVMRLVPIDAEYALICGIIEKGLKLFVCSGGSVAVGQGGSNCHHFVAIGNRLLGVEVI